jgi:LysR family hydrogen peroxide-inducible transcriptional activator
MELQQLRYLVAVAETGNFTRASERSGVSQPSLSQQIINLERELGHKLFHRLGRKAVLTEAGAAFLERSRRILFEVENATKELSDHPTLERRITVGAIPTLAPFILPVLIERCRKRHPNLQIFGHENFRTPLVNLLLEGVLDLAVVAMPVDDPRIDVERLFREPLLLVVGKSHPLASRAEVTAADLADETFVMLGSSSSLAAQVQAFCGDHHLQPRIGFRCAQLSTVKALVEMGAGISILPRVAQAPDDKETLVYVSLSAAAPVREVAVIRHIQRYQSRGAEQFLVLLREFAKEFVAAAP